MLPKKPSSAQRHKVQIFWEAHKNLWKLPLFSKCTNHDEDFVKIFVLLRKSEFWNYKFHLNCLEHSISHCYTNRLILGPSLVLCSSLSTLQSFTGKYREIQGKPCNENREPAMRTGFPCNESRYFPVGIDLQGFPVSCTGFGFAVYNHCETNQPNSNMVSRIKNTILRI